ncbi:16 kDa allergen [Aspergillus ambiguus]|uniref:16 kDa allergen n=1 Tax=Aspergillus ambiguus TaxID=176160 RepID=UPI003CCE24D4
MKASLITFGALLGLVSAQNAVVNNFCDTVVYVQSFPYDSSAAGPLTPLDPGEQFSEPFRASGSTIKMAKTRTLNEPLFFGYSFSSNPDYAYYELSTEWGNPFAGNHNSLDAGAGCEAFDCAPNDADCYSTPAHKKVYGCPQPVTLTADLCKD